MANDTLFADGRAPPLCGGRLGAAAATSLTLAILADACAPRPTRAPQAARRPYRSPAHPSPQPRGRKHLPAPNPRLDAPQQSQLARIHKEAPRPRDLRLEARLGEARPAHGHQEESASGELSVCVRTGSDGVGAGEVSERVRGAPGGVGGGGGEGKNDAGNTAAGNVDHFRAPGPPLAGVPPLLEVGGGVGTTGRKRSKNAITGNCAVFDGALGNGRCIPALAFGGRRTRDSYLSSSFPTHVLLPHPIQHLQMGHHLMTLETHIVPQPVPHANGSSAPLPRHPTAVRKRHVARVAQKQSPRPPLVPWARPRTAGKPTRSRLPGWMGTATGASCVSAYRGRRGARVSAVDVHLLPIRAMQHSIDAPPLPALKHAHHELGHRLPKRAHVRIQHEDVVFQRGNDSGIFYSAKEYLTMGKTLTNPHRNTPLPPLPLDRRHETRRMRRERGRGQAARGVEHDVGEDGVDWLWRP
ncbi:hypothetical protein C8F04DRAFT_1390984 [Mycena alexandri]|uniref:Uncharacterized protein n=1 Tax=Mycena alexandri TaxID=1745969 RepID=A0AAD6XAZ2_9AGAR|nr:hypothetical protein C8F04DRAFT_1390984 [Mycena alexandri]